MSQQDSTSQSNHVLVPSFRLAFDPLPMLAAVTLLLGFLPALAFMIPLWPCSGLPFFCEPAGSNFSSSSWAGIFFSTGFCAGMELPALLLMVRWEIPGFHDITLTMQRLAFLLWASRIQLLNQTMCWYLLLIRLEGWVASLSRSFSTGFCAGMKLPSLLLMVRWEIPGFHDTTLTLGLPFFCEPAGSNFSIRPCAGTFFSTRRMGSLFEQRVFDWLLCWYGTPNVTTNGPMRNPWLCRFNEAIKCASFHASISSLWALGFDLGFDLGLIAVPVPWIFFVANVLGCLKSSYQFSAIERVTPRNICNNLRTFSIIVVMWSIRAGSRHARQRQERAPHLVQLAPVSTLKKEASRMRWVLGLSVRLGTDNRRKGKKGG